MSWLDLTNAVGNTIEAGEYVVTAKEAEVKETASGTGEYVKVKFVTEQGQVIFHNFNIKNQNEMAQKIGLGQLKDFIRCAGKADPNKLGSPSELCGLSAIAKVKLETKGDFEGQPRITGFKKAEKKVASPFL
jgi:hypothetical protein